MAFNYSRQLDDVAVLTWVFELVRELKSRNLSSWSELGGIFGSRFEIWEGAWRMLWQFPLAGLGQGNFYHLSSIAPFSKSHFLVLNGGENTHNYFLQTLVETGLVGAIIFLVAIIFPYWKSLNKVSMLPAALALFSLFLGNIFSHSFLVRENLILGAVILGLIYSQSLIVGFKVPILGSPFNKSTIRLIIILLVISSAGAYFHEIYQSFGRFPFKYGFYCYQNVPLTSDGWTKGVFQAPTPPGTRGVNLVLEYPPYEDGKKPIKISLELKHFIRYLGYNRSIDSVTKEVLVNRKNDIDINIEFSKQDDINNPKNSELEMHLSDCYSPRNLGDSVDSRLLGIKVKSIRMY